MKSLESRIAALERQEPTDSAETVIIRAMLAAGDESEIHRLRSMGGAQHWERQPGETEDAFTDRAAREVERQPGAVALLFEG
jgi:hypothetical protein